MAILAGLREPNLVEMVIKVIINIVFNVTLVDILPIADRLEIV